MTRMVVALEGVNVNNCIIVPGALRCDEEVPVVWRSGHPSKPLGKASKLERRLDGDNIEVTMEVELNVGVDLDLEDKIGAFVYASPFKAEEHPFVKGALRHVTAARIREINLQDLG